MQRDRAELAVRTGAALPPPGDREVAPDILSEIASSLSREDDLEALLQRLLGKIIELTGASAGAVRVLTEDGTRLRLVGAIGLPHDVQQHEASVDGNCGVCGDAARHDRVEETTDLRRCAEQSSCAYFGQECARLLAIPLRHHGMTLGVYNLFLRADRIVGGDTLSLLRSIGELLGVALENERLARAGMRATLLNERHLMANEVHDSLAQSLAYMKMRMALLEKSVAGHDEAQSLKYAGDVRQALDAAYVSLRELLTHFRSRMDPHGLLHALKETTDGYYEKTGVRLDFENHAPEIRLPVEQELQVFHIVKEALANVSRHSGARHARLLLNRKKGRYEITVEDDGSGMAEPRESAIPGEAPDAAHLGLKIMRERARQLGGEVRIQNVNGRGTRVQLRFPAIDPHREGGA